MYRQYELIDGSIEPVYSNQVPQEIWDKVLVFQQRIKDIYFLRQEGVYGIKSLGNAIRSDVLITELFKPEVGTSLLVKSTRNRSETEKLFISTVLSCRDLNINDVYFLVLSSELRQQSRIFDSSSMSIDSWRHTVDQLFKVFTPKYKLKVFFIEINSFPDCYFEHHPLKPEFSRIINSNHA